jgi:uncharacterized protein YceH (UPF0502 family)
LRGPQTLGEIRGRTTRLYEFEDLAQAREALGNLTEWGLVRRLSRMPGHKESRYIHLLGGEVEAAEIPASPDTEPVPAVELSRIENIEQALEGLRDEMDALKAEFAEFKKQFE